MSCRSDPIVRKAPVNDRTTETPQRPGLPTPRISSASENQFFDFANLVATYALATLTDAMAMNNFSGCCKPTTVNEPKSKPPVMTCIPNQMLDETMPSEARLPDDL